VCMGLLTLIGQRHVIPTSFVNNKVGFAL